MICNRQVARVWSAQLKSCWLHILCSIFENVQPVYDFYYGKCIWQQFCTHNLIENRKQQTEFWAENFHKFVIGKRGEQVKARVPGLTNREGHMKVGQSLTDTAATLTTTTWVAIAVLALSNHSELSLSWVNTTIGCAAPCAGLNKRRQPRNNNKVKWKCWSNQK